MQYMEGDYDNEDSQRGGDDDVFEEEEGFHQMNSNYQNLLRNESTRPEEDKENIYNISN